jgi:4'-phosphopantetheinyl transferase
MPRVRCERTSDCHVWWARLASYQPALEARLDDRELQRAGAFGRPEDRARFVLGCALTKMIVGWHLSTPPGDISLDRTCPQCGRPHGKPRVVAGDSAVEVSVSHAGQLVVVALHPHAPVGIDVELIGAALDYDEIARVALSAPEAARLSRLPAEHRASAVATYWVRKEAYAKALGVGLRFPLSRITVSAPDEPPRVIATDAPERAAKIQMRDLAVLPGYVAAVAVLTPEPVRVRVGDPPRLTPAPVSSGRPPGATVP